LEDPKDLFALLSAPLSHRVAPIGATGDALQEA
jgi:hypothetical protein